MSIEADPELVKRVRTLEKDLEEARQRLSDDIMSRTPYGKGDVVRDKYTGNRYRIDGGYAGHIGHGLYCHLRAYRVYTTGRREATSTTTLSLHNIEKVTD